MDRRKSDESEGSLTREELQEELQEAQRNEMDRFPIKEVGSYIRDSERPKRG